MRSHRLGLKDRSAAGTNTAAVLPSFKDIPLESSASIERWRQAAHVEPGEENEDRGISTSLVEVCEKCLQTIIDLARPASHSDCAWQRLGRCHDLLRLWADGHGVYNGTFDSILDRSSSLRHAVVAVLSHLCGTLLRRLEIISKGYSDNDPTSSLRHTAAEFYEQSKRLVAYTEPHDSDSEGDISDSESDFDLDEASQWVVQVKTYIDCLTDIGISLEHPALEPEPEEQASLLGLEQRSAHDYHTDLILAKHPQVDLDLAQVLGRLSWDRYQRLQLNRDRQAQMAENQSSEAKSHVAGTDFQDSGVGTSIPATVPSYATTTVSFMTSLTTGADRIRIPPLPAEAKIGKSFECVACCKNVRIIDNRAWRKHLYHDLQPYTCLYKDCTFSTSTFDTRDLWSVHLELDHNLGPAWEATTCPLCRETTKSGKTALLVHFARHLEEISLAALPAEVESDAESDTDTLSGSKASDAAELASNSNEQDGSIHEIAASHVAEQSPSIRDQDSDTPLSLRDKNKQMAGMGAYEDDSEEDEVTRCVCGHLEFPGLPPEIGRNITRGLPTNVDTDHIDSELDSLYIQCDICHVWQHGHCVGIFSAEDAPENYYCERDRPQLHTLRKSVNGNWYSDYDTAFKEDSSHTIKARHIPNSQQSGRRSEASRDDDFSGALDTVRDPPAKLNRDHDSILSVGSVRLAELPLDDIEIRTTLAFRESMLGKDHPDTLRSMSDLATVLVGQGRYEEADQIHRRVLDAQREVLGESNLETLASANNLAISLGRQGKYREAEKIHREVLSLRAKSRGAEHQLTQESMSNLASLLQGQGKYAEAEQLYLGALSGQEKASGKDDPKTL